MKKIISLTLALLMLVTCAACFAACNGDDDVLVMATNAAFPPYEFKDDNGELAGIDVEIAKLIAEKLGMELKIHDIDFGAIVSGVHSGKYDMGMAGMTVTEERLKEVNFSTSYAKGIQSVIVKEDSTYQDINDFFNLDEEGNWVSVKEGITIGVQQDTTGDIYASDTVENWGFGDENVKRYNTGAEAVLALSTGKVSAVIIDNEPAKSYVETTEGLRILDSVYAEEDYAICIAKENTELLEKINKALEELIADGTVDRIIKKYIKA